MLLLQQWQQTENFEPDNPTQARFETYFALPGGHVSTYWNGEAVTGGTLMGPVDTAVDMVKSNWKILGAIGLVAGALLAYKHSR